MDDAVNKGLKEHLLVFESMLSDGSFQGSVRSVADAIISSYRKGGKVLLFGCGGSAADSQHIAAEFISRFALERKSLPAIALTTDSSILSAISNDYSFERVFKRQVEGLAHAGDVVIGISTSGKSRAVLSALDTAKEIDTITVLFTGNNKEPYKGIDHVIRIPSTSTPRIQEGHITIAHIICGMVERGLFDEQRH
jgi:D-sedoheptulose 7-phosphate isomerase